MSADTYMITVASMICLLLSYFVNLDSQLKTGFVSSGTAAAILTSILMYQDSMIIL